MTSITVSTVWKWSTNLYIHDAILSLRSFNASNYIKSCKILKRIYSYGIRVLYEFSFYWQKGNVKNFFIKMEFHRLRMMINTVEPHYNKDLGTMKITLLYQVSHYIRVKKQRNIKSWDQSNYLVIRGFCYIRPLYNEVPLYYQSDASYCTRRVHACNLSLFNILFYIILDEALNWVYCIVMITLYQSGASCSTQTHQEAFMLDLAQYTGRAILWNMAGYNAMGDIDTINKNTVPCIG